MMLILFYLSWPYTVKMMENIKRKILNLIFLISVLTYYIVNIYTSLQCPLQHSSRGNKSLKMLFWVLVAFL